MLGDDVLDGFKGSADLTGELDMTWRKTELLLRCAHLGSLGLANPENTNDKLPSEYVFRPVHAVAAVDCPRPVVKMASLLYPGQLEEVDEMGMTPLLIASKAPIFKVRDLSDEGFMLEERIYGDDDSDRSDNMNDDDRNDSSQPSVIDILVNANPRAAFIRSSKGPYQGRLPLHLAIDTGKSWSEGVKTIVSAYPEAVSKLDPKTRLFPFLQAAVIDRPDCSTILELLKKDPSLVMYFPNQQPSHVTPWFNNCTTDMPDEIMPDGDLRRHDCRMVEDNGQTV
jgi:hypothetical protein